jgi:hypothetical protein
MRECSLHRFFISLPILARERRFELRLYQTEIAEILAVTESTAAN